MFTAQNYGLTRFAGSIIHQNMSEEDAILSIRVARGQRLGACATNQLDPEGIRAAVEQAVAMADLTEPNPDFCGFARPAPLDEVRGPVYVEATAAAGPEERADYAARLIGAAGRSGFEAAGAISNGVYVTAVATSHGQAAYQMETRSHGLTVVNRPGQAGFGTGYAEKYGRDFSALNPEELGERAAQSPPSTTIPSRAAVGTPWCSPPKRWGCCSTTCPGWASTPARCRAASPS